MSRIVSRNTAQHVAQRCSYNFGTSPILFPVCVYLSTRGSQLCISTVPGDISNCPVFFRKKKKMEKKREKSLSTLPRCVPGRRGVPVRPPGCPYLLVYWTDFKNKKTKWGVYGGSESIGNTHFTVRTRKSFLTQFYRPNIISSTLSRTCCCVIYHSGF